MRNNTQITDEEFSALLNMDKYFEEKEVMMPGNGERVHFKLHSAEKRENFYLDVNRSGIIELKKFTLQNRFLVVPLVRLDIDSAPHINPDGSKTSRNHIHIYKEGYGDSWAFDLGSSGSFHFAKCSSFREYFIEFCKYCNIQLSQIQLLI